MRYITHIIIVLGSPLLMAQEIDSLQFLESIEVYASKSINVGHFTQKFHTDSRQNIQAMTVAEVLEKQAAIPFKNYGNGMLSSISYRGLSANYVNAFWNDIPLNSAMNGQMDYNTLPTELITNAYLREGGGASVLGNGTIGAGIILDTNTNYPNDSNQAVHISISQSLGSFGLSRSIGKAQSQIGKWHLQIGGATFRLINDYKVPTLNGVQKQSNAKVESQHYLGAIQYHVDPNRKLCFSYWLNPNKRQLPGNYFAPFSDQLQIDSHQRYQLSFEESQKKFSQKLQLGYTIEKFDFYLQSANNQGSKSEVKNIFPLYQLQWNMKNNWQLLTQIKGQISNGNSENFGQPNRQDLTLSSTLYKELSSKWRSSLSLQKGFSSAFQIPFTMDWGWEFQPNQNYVLTANFTTNYRTPTFNDLYWIPGGNKELLSENGIMTEVGLKMRALDQQLKWNQKIYYGKVENMIQWQPTSSGIWSPFNLNEVETYGWESQLEFQKKWTRFYFLSSLLYRFTHSKDVINNSFQPYIPKHSLSLRLNFAYQKWKLKYLHNYISKRPIHTQASRPLEAYQLSDINISYPIGISSLECGLSAGIKNLFNLTYEGTKGYYMPPRNYMIQLQIKL